MVRLSTRSQVPPVAEPEHATPEAEESEEDDDSDTHSDDVIGDDVCEDDDENPNVAYESVYPFLALM